MADTQQSLGYAHRGVSRPVDGQPTCWHSTFAPHPTRARHPCRKTLTAGEGRRANAFPVKSSVKDGRLGLCGVDASHCKAEPPHAYAGPWQCGCTDCEVRLQLSCCSLTSVGHL
ncbi:hypothetical protein BD309DRAFT_718144 [Dichomitus squalens]|nr:hypothetical protein BD309DRAFT_718144 [Dichomitus squalens]